MGDKCKPLGNGQYICPRCDGFVLECDIYVTDFLEVRFDYDEVCEECYDDLQDLETGEDL